MNGIMAETEFKKIVDLSFQEEVQRIEQSVPQSRVQHVLRARPLSRLSVLPEESSSSESLDSLLVSSRRDQSRQRLTEQPRQGFTEQVRQRLTEQPRQRLTEQPRQNLRESLKRSTFGLFMGPSLTQVRAQEQRAQERAHLQPYSVRPVGRVVPTNPCADLTGSEARSCNSRLQQGFLDSLPTRTTRQ
jgi:hypothetical protein